MSKYVFHTEFGDPSILQIGDRDVPLPGPGRVRIRVGAAGLNPVDWKILASPELASAFGVSVPSGFGNDFAGVIDALGEGVTEWVVGERVFGGSRGDAVAEYIVVDPAQGTLHRTPEALDDVRAASLDIAARTASAVADVLAAKPGETVLVAAAAGGVGTILTQVLVRAGVRVLGTGSASTAPYLRELGAEPVTYGPGLADRVRELAPEGIAAVADLYEADTAVVGIELGVDPARIATIGHPAIPEGVQRTGGADVRPGQLAAIAELIAEGQISVVIAETFPLERIHEAVELQRDHHTHGKIVVTIAA